MQQSLGNFLEILEKKNLLVRVKNPVSLYLEMTEIHKRMLVAGREAILFENVIFKDGRKSNIPVLVNLFGTKERVSLALGYGMDKLTELGEMLAFMRQPKPVSSISEAIGYLPLLKKVMNMRPKVVSSAECQQVIYKGGEVDLNMLPIQSLFPNEPAPLITFGICVTKGPTYFDKKLEKDELDDFNLGIYRLQLLEKNKLIMRWLKHRGGALQFARFKEKFPNQNMPCAVVIGADEKTIMAAVTPVPDTLSEYKFAGLLRGEKTRLIKCISNDILVPASAEIVLEGEILCDETAMEGPYGDHTGFYNEVDSFPVFKVNCITMKKNPIYHSTFTSRPMDEPAILAETLNDVFVPLIKQQFPEIVDFYLPMDACSYRMAFVSIKKSYGGQAKRIMMGVWSYLRQFMYTKWVVIFDEDINIRNYSDVIWAMSVYVDPIRDFMTVADTPIDYLDFASPVSGLGSKIGIDATAKIHPETNRIFGKKIEMDQDVVKKVDKDWAKYGLGEFIESVWKK